MNKLVYILFISLFFIKFLHFGLGIIPRSATWMLEFFPPFTFVIIAIMMGVRKGLVIHFKYLYLILIYFIIIFSGILLNGTPPGSIFVGMRTHLKFIPFFLLPAAYDFSPRQFKAQLTFILPLLMLQCPVAIIQRVYFIQKKIFSGDPIAGTLSLSSVLTIIMLCSISVLFAFYLRKRVSLIFFIILTCCLFLPTTINETKGTFILLPIVIFLPTLLNKRYMDFKVIKRFLPMTLLFVAFISVFTVVYGHLTTYQSWSKKKNPGIFEFFLDRQKLESYLYKGVEGRDGEEIRRLDAFVLAYKGLSENFGNLMFGLGLGSVTHSQFGSLSGGNLDQTKYGAVMVALTNIFWELGILGVGVYICFFVLVFGDALFLRKYEGIFGSFALGWCAVVVVIGISLIYKNILQFDVITFLFSYFSGVVAAERFRSQHSDKSYLVNPAIRPHKQE